jgi:hypothetical protein
LVAVDVVAAVAEEDTVEVVVEPGKLSHILYIFSCLNFDRLADIVNLLRFLLSARGKDARLTGIRRSLQFHIYRTRPMA